MKFEVNIKERHKTIKKVGKFETTIIKISNDFFIQMLKNNEIINIIPIDKKQVENMLNFINNNK